MANPASEALAACGAAVVVASDGSTWDGTVSRVAKPDTGAEGAD